MKFGSRQDGIPIGTPNPGVRIRDLGGQSGRFQANHALFVAHDRFRSPIPYNWLWCWYDQYIVVSGAGLLAGLSKKKQNMQRVTAGFPKKSNVQKACGV
jgi:hypothetical protein